MNVTQNASRSPSAVLVPCLIKNSRLFCMSNQRLLTLAEMFQVQGFPIFNSDGIPFQCFWVMLTGCFFQYFQCSSHSVGGGTEKYQNRIFLDCEIKCVLCVPFCEVLSKIC